MKPYVIEPSDWWNDCGTWRYDDESEQFSVTVFAGSKQGSAKLGAYSTTYASGHGERYYDPTQDEQKPALYGYALHDVPDFLNEDGEPCRPVALAPGFLSEMERFRDRDGAAEWAAQEFARHCRETGGRTYRTDLDALDDMETFIIANEEHSGVDPLAAVCFLFERGFETEAGKPERLAA